MRFPQKQWFILQSALLVAVCWSHDCPFVLAFRSSSLCGCRRSKMRATTWNHFPPRLHARHSFQLLATVDDENNDNDNDSTQNRNQSKFNMQELYSRIRNLQQLEQEESQWIATKGALRELPAICFDALLPRQRLVGTTSDDTFGRFLKELGIGGIFVMTSLNYGNGKRRIRRDAALCKIEVVDAPMNDPGGECSNTFLPTAVDFSILGLQRCRLVGPATEMQARIGRWRRCYDPNGEEAILGWGMERFVDSNGTVLEDIEIDTTMCSSTWTATPVQVNDLDDKDVQDPTTLALCQRIPALLEEWQVLASNERTYENVDVVATARRRSGYPGLRIDAAALLRNVRAELGPIPVQCPSELAMYGAALINPLPALGVAPEIRGRILSASSAHQRLTILEWGIQRSIENLKGIRPL